MEYFEFRAMNTEILLGAESRHGKLEKAFSTVQAFIVESEARFSRFMENSELSNLNRLSGSWAEVSADLFTLLELSQKFHQETAGLFNPAILDALEYAGYDRSMDEIRATEVHQPAFPKRPIVPRFSDVRLDHENCMVFLPAGTHIDLGGIAKGWIAEKGANLLSEYATTSVVDAGGDMFMIGLPENQSSWQVDLENPLDPEQNVAVLNVGPGAIATSSIVKRSWMQDQHHRHHLIDPRSGKPAETDWLSVTVIAPHAAKAEVFAKVLLIGGKSAAASLTARHIDIYVIAVDHHGLLWGSNNIQEVLYGQNQFSS